MQRRGVGEWKKTGAFILQGRKQKKVDNCIHGRGLTLGAERMVNELAGFTRGEW